MSRLRPAPAPADPGADTAALRVHGDTMVRPGDADHAVNVLAGGPPPWLASALAGALADGRLTRYPDPAPARAAVARMHGRTPEEVVVTNGAADALWRLGPALDPRRSALIQPGFTETEAGLRAHGVAVRRVTDPADLVADLAPDADLVVVTNPTSPDGRLRSRAELLALRAPGRTLVVDEAFMSMVPGDPESLATAALDDVIVIRSMTKLLSVPGLRVGYALAPPDMAARLDALAPPWSANALALTSLETAAAHPEELAALARRAAAEREDLTARLTRIDGVVVHPSHTNFVLVEVADGPALVAALRAQRIAVRPAVSFPGFGDGHIRLTARDPAANARLVAAIAEAL